MRDCFADERLAGFGRRTDPLGDIDRHSRLARIDADPQSVLANQLEQCHRGPHGIRGRIERRGTIRSADSSSPP